MCHVAQALHKRAGDTTKSANAKTPSLNTRTPTTLDVHETLAYGVAHTGHPACVDVSSILTRHASCTYRSVHLHADRRGAGAVSVQMKHSGGGADSSSAIQARRMSLSIAISPLTSHISATP